MPFSAQTLVPAQVVKEATSAAHRETEDVLLPALQSLATLRQYAGVLRVLYGYFAPLQARVRSLLSPAQVPDLHDRRSADWLLHDLASLGFPTTGLPLATTLPVLDTVPAAFGALYVLEGSTLGGKMIAHMLAKNTALSVPPEALRFFKGYGADTGVRWTAFLQAMNQQPAVDQMAAAANDTFLHLKAWMQDRLPHEQTP